MAEQGTIEEKRGVKDSAGGLDADFIEALYGDPFRAETTRAGRHLVVLSVITIAVVVFKVSFTSSSLLPLDLTSHQDALPKILSVAVLLLVLSFVFRATTDLFRDVEATVLVTRYVERERVVAAENSARAVEDEIAAGQREEYEGPSEPDPWWEPYYEIKDAADEAVSKAQERLGIRRLPRALRRVRKSLEFAVPLAFAVLALVLTARQLFAFTTAVFSALWP